MDKPWYTSKTLLGFGVAVIVALAQVFQVPMMDSLVAELVKYIAGFVGVVGLRTAVGKSVPAK